MPFANEAYMDGLELRIKELQDKLNESHERLAMVERMSVAEKEVYAKMVGFPRCHVTRCEGMQRVVDAANNLFASQKGAASQFSELREALRDLESGD